MKIKNATNHGFSNCAVCSLRNDMVFAEISRYSVIGFHTQVTDYSLPRGMVLQAVGTPVTALYCIRKGVVKLIKYEDNGDQHIVRLLKKGDIATIEWVFADKSDHSAVAIGEVHACRIPIKFFHDFILRHADIQNSLLHKFRDALHEAELWLSQLAGGTIPVRVRIARILLRLCEGDNGDILHLPNDDLASILGVTEETVSRVISKFRQLGILMRDSGSPIGRYTRADVPALKIIAANVLPDSNEEVKVF